VSEAIQGLIDLAFEDGAEDLKQEVNTPEKDDEIEIED
jgi:hypothetical protein